MAGSAQTLLLAGTTSTPASGNLQILVVAGGGYGGGGFRSGLYANSAGGGGAGAGGVIAGNIGYVTGNYTVTIGASYANSVFGNLTAVRGGRGGPGYVGTPLGCFDMDGGSGGGSGTNNLGPPCAQYGNGITGQGYRGGITRTDYAAGGGGGGAGQVGYDAGSFNYDGGNGGNGIQSNITGTLTYYGGGGGGGKGSSFYFGQRGIGGLGGGGGSPSLNGTVNTGGGGGGYSGFLFSTGGQGGLGGSGIVIIKFPDANPAAITTGSPTVNVADGYRIYTFTGSGTIELV